MFLKIILKYGVIHKIILLVFNSFWLELAIEKKVKINISKCSRMLDFDYESISAALASPLLIIKLACFSDTTAPPIAYPFKPQASIRRPA